MTDRLWGEKLLKCHLLGTAPFTSPALSSVIFSKTLTYIKTWAILDPQGLSPGTKGGGCQGGVRRGNTPKNTPENKPTPKRGGTLVPTGWVGRVTKKQLLRRERRGGVPTVKLFGTRNTATPKRDAKDTSGVL